MHGKTAPLTFPSGSVLILATFTIKRCESGLDSLVKSGRSTVFAKLLRIFRGDASCDPCALGRLVARFIPTSTEDDGCAFISDLSWRPF